MPLYCYQGISIPSPRRANNKANTDLPIIGPLWGESTSQQWIPLPKAVMQEVFSCHNIIMHCQSPAQASVHCISIFHISISIFVTHSLGMLLLHTWKWSPMRVRTMLLTLCVSSFTTQRANNEIHQCFVHSAHLWWQWKGARYRMQDVNTRFKCTEREHQILVFQQLSNII